MRASAGALAVHTALILAGGHVRASAGALAVHTALFLPRVTCAKRRGPGGPQRFNSCWRSRAR